MVKGYTFVYQAKVREYKNKTVFTLNGISLKSCFERALLVQKKCYYIFKNAVSLNFNPNPRRALRIDSKQSICSDIRHKYHE